jgi:hypothetical protein
LNDFFLEFVTRSGCHLCDEALPVVRRVARLMRADLIQTQVESNDALLREFDLRIPVVRDPRGNVLAEGRVELWSLMTNTVRARFGRR